MQRIRRFTFFLFLAVFVTTVCITAVSPRGRSALDLLLGRDEDSNEFQPQVLKDETRRIDLVQPLDRAKTIYESKFVRIQVSDSQFAAYQEWAQQTDSLSKQLPSLGELTADAAVDYDKKNFPHPKNHALIAHILLSGCVSVYDKRNQIEVAFIKVRDYALVWCPICGSGDWYFSLPDETIFFEETYLNM